MLEPALWRQVLAELDKPQPFSLAAWAASRRTIAAEPPPNSHSDALPGPDCSQVAEACARMGSQQVRQRTADEPCFPSAEVAAPEAWSQSAEASVANAQGSPALQQPSASAVQRFASPPQRSARSSPGKENHGKNRRLATLFTQNTLAGRLKAAASYGHSSPAPLQHANSSPQEDAACRENKMEGSMLLPGAARHHESAHECTPGWLSSRLQRDRIRLDEAVGRKSALHHASSAVDQRFGGIMAVRGRSRTEPHISGSAGDAEQRKSVAPDASGRRGIARWCASSAPAQHASLSNAGRSHSMAGRQAVLREGGEGKAASSPDQEMTKGDARQHPSSSAGVALDAHDHRRCGDRIQQGAAQAGDPELRAMGLSGRLHADHEGAAVPRGVDVEPQVSRNSVDADRNVAVREGESSGVDERVVATGFWRKKRQKMGGVLDLWNRAAQNT